MRVFASFPGIQQQLLSKACFSGHQPEGTRELYRSLNGAGKEHKAGSILLVVDPDKQDSEKISHMHAAKSRIDEALAPLSEQQADFIQT
jgi:hypothetical protein